jgi:hypothetical protein
VSIAATPREEEKVPPLLTTKDLREEEVFRILFQCAAASREEERMPPQVHRCPREEERAI